MNFPACVVCPRCNRTVPIIVRNPTPYIDVLMVECPRCGDVILVETWVDVHAMVHKGER